jgi:DNA invertase Pin-like site-specific DNA recombinase
MTKITADHLARGAYVYVRQSTVDQVHSNLESQRRQYGLVDRARQIGWTEVVVIDDDLGRSGGGTARPGFEKLLAAICAGRVGAVLSIEASWLARNGRDWHTLLEFCGLVGTLLVDEEGVYDPRSINDRLLLGMKGTMSEMELSVFRQRSMEAMRQKARRGELFLTVAVGYVKVGKDRIEKDADLRVRDALDLVFRKFAEVQTIRQVLVWFRQQGMELPVAATVAPTGERQVRWCAPVYSTLHHILTNPVYAGAYAYGRKTSRATIENGRKRAGQTWHRHWHDWEVLIRDHHEGYISWAEYVRNQELMAENANGKSYLVRGSPRKGEALLPGLFRCARCGRRLQVAYSGSDRATQRYVCTGAFSHLAAASCIAFGGMRVDRAVAAEVLSRLQPLGVEAALAAIAAQGQERIDKRRQLENALQQARYEAALAQRQYDATDPGNRLVAGELERRWNVRLADVQTREQDLQQLEAEPTALPTETDRQRLLTLGQDLTRAWDQPGVTPETRKRIIRTVIEEIVVDVTSDTLELVIHWRGGDHTNLRVKKNRAGHTRWTTEAEVIDLLRVLARQMSDTAIAALLNRAGKSTGRGNSWNRSRVCAARNQQGIAVYREGERAERGEATLEEAARILSISVSTVRRLIGSGILPAQQLCKGAPWIIRHADLQRGSVRQSAELRRQRRPPPDDERQESITL